MIQKIGLSGALLFLCSCSTPEYRAEKSVCSATWLKKIPTRYEQEMYNRMESRQVPTGRTTCHNFGYTISCNQVMRTEYYTVSAVRTVDRNKSRRDSAIKTCTQNQCLKKYGTSDCKA